MKIKRTLPKNGAFTQVHSHILKDFVGHQKAGFVLIQILSNTEKYIKSISDLKKKIGISDKEWRNIRDVLISKGYMKKHKINNVSADKFGWDEIQISDTPVIEWIEELNGKKDKPEEESKDKVTNLIIYGQEKIPVVKLDDLLK